MSPPLTPIPWKPGAEAPLREKLLEPEQTLSKQIGKIRKTLGFRFQAGLEKSPWDKEKHLHLLPLSVCVIFSQAVEPFPMQLQLMQEVGWLVCVTLGLISTLP